MRGPTPIPPGERVCSCSRSTTRCGGKRRFARMADDGVTHTLEIGPGKVLAGLVKRIAKEIEVVAVGTPRRRSKPRPSCSRSLEGGATAGVCGRSIARSSRRRVLLMIARACRQMFARSSTGKRAHVQARWQGRARHGRLARHRPGHRRGARRARRARRRQLRRAAKRRPARSPTASSRAAARPRSLGFDVADTEGVRRRPSPTPPNALGRLDILVANAGISIDGLLLRLKDEDIDRTLARQRRRGPLRAPARRPR